MIFSDAGVRAAGLGTHLVKRADLALLAKLDPGARIAALSQRGFLGATYERAGAIEVDLGLRRRAAEWLALLIRWCGERARALVALFEAGDRLAIRTMLRGAAAGAPAGLRLRGLIPTPALPERALELLADAARPREVAARLVAMGSPYGPPLFPEVERKEPDLFALELALDRTFVARASSAARGADRHLREHLRASIDLANAEIAAALHRDDRALAEQAFLEGGERIDRAAFGEVIAAEEDATARLDELLAGLPRSLSDRIRFEREAARRDPTSTAPLIHYVLSLRAHLWDLGRLVWAGALGAPSTVLDESWVTP